MNILNAPQGSEEWHAARAQRFCASEAAAAMGLSKHTSRSALLKAKATGLRPEVAPAVQRVFDAGHEAEALARPIAESIIGEDLFPVVATLDVDGLPLLASFDGLTLMEDTAWENKLLNPSLVAQIEAGNLEPHYWAQLEHQLLVSGASKALFTTSDGTPGGTHHLWYEPQPERRAQVLAAWRQFAADLAAYQPEAAEPVVVGAAPDTLPALLVQVQGAVTASNLAEFKAVALAAIGSIKTELASDQDFADAEKTIKWCHDVEGSLAAAKQHALAQTASIEELFRTMDAIGEQTRAVRLKLDKLVKSEKEARKEQLVLSAQRSMGEHIEKLNRALAKEGAGQIKREDAGLFAQAIKGLKSLDSMRDKVHAAMAQAQAQANATADRMRANRASLRSDDGRVDWIFLFADFATVGVKEAEDFAALAQLRITQHQQREAAKLEAERERIRQEEAAKLQRDAEAKARAEAAELARQQDEAERQASDNKRNQDAALASQTQAAIKVDYSGVAAYCCEKGEAQGKVGRGCDECSETSAAYQAAMFTPQAERAPAEPVAGRDFLTTASGETLTLGALNALLSPIRIDAAGLAELGFEPCATVKAAKHYPAAAVPRICAALVRHIQTVQADQPAPATLATPAEA